MPRVIVVDDEKDCISSLQQTLGLLGIDVVGTGEDGEEAYQLYEKTLPDVVLLDLNMPKYDGPYAIEKINSKYPNSKIVVLTAYMDYKFDINKVVGVICKPYNPHELAKIIKRICSPNEPEVVRFKVEPFVIGGSHTKIFTESKNN